MQIVIPEERLEQAVQALRDRNPSLERDSDEVLEKAIEIAVNDAAEAVLDDLSLGRMIYGRCLGRSLDGALRKARALVRLLRQAVRAS